MDNEEKFMIVMAIIVAIAIIIGISVIMFGTYEFRKIKITNFENTIINLNDEQKCLHICGFQFDSLFESYKFCIEKCDRISERMVNGCGINE